MSEKQKHSFSVLLLHTAMIIRRNVYSAESSQDVMQSGMMKVYVVPSVFLIVHYS